MNSPFSTIERVLSGQRPISAAQFLESSLKIIYEISAPDLLAMHANGPGAFVFSGPVPVLETGQNRKGAGNLALKNYNFKKVRINIIPEILERNWLEMMNG